MLVHGFHRVAELRERSASGADASGFEVWLDAQKEGSSAILISFTDRADHAIQLIRSRPTPLIQYARPRAELSEFLRAFPAGSLVVSAFSEPKPGAGSLHLTRYEGAATATDMGDLLRPPAQQQDQEQVATSALNPDLIGTWETGGRQYDIRTDGSFFVGDVQPYELRDSGATLYWQPMTFARLSGDPGGVPGHWQSNDSAEDVLMRTDGTYVWHTVGDFPDALGEWSVASGDLSSWELRAHVSTSGNTITFDSVFSNSIVGSYALNGDKSELTVQIGATTVVYTRV